MAEQTPTDIKTPVRYDDQSNRMIFDAEGHHLIDIRGWGYLTGVGGLNLPDDVAIRIQDERCDWIVNAINQHATLLTENAELKAKLEEAEKVIDLYADIQYWVDMDERELVSFGDSAEPAQEYRKQFPKEAK